MATDVSNCLDLPFMHTPSHHQSAQAVSYLGGGELPLIAEEIPLHQAKYYGDSQRQLILRQAPMHARVAVGKEKGVVFGISAEMKYGAKHQNLQIVNR